MLHVLTYSQPSGAKHCKGATGERKITRTNLEITPRAMAPSQAIPEAAGLDIYTPELTRINPNQMKGLVTAHSCLALKNVHVMGRVMGGEYQGEIQVNLFNKSKQDLVILSHDRIAHTDTASFKNVCEKRGSTSSHHHSWGQRVQIHQF
uniref:dUTPase-like domain-containing protein n=1 Tax=Nothoprocta perdicaria TaxID=30464 RepID=A0A8C6YVZ3_NOTPE